MMMREPGFMGLAKQRAKREGMLEVPKRYQPDGGGPEEYPAFVNEQEMAMLKKQGGKGFMTPYGVPSFYTPHEQESDSNLGSKVSSGPDMFTADDSGTFSDNMSLQGAVNSMRDATQTQDSGGNWRWKQGQESPEKRPDETAEEYHKRMTGDPSNSGGSGEAPQGLSGLGQTGISEEDAKKREEEAAAKALQQQRDSKRQGYIDEYGGYKGEAKGLGTESKAITEQFGKDADTLAGYQSGFDKMAAEAKTRGDAGQDYFQGAVDPTTGKRTGGVASEYKDTASTGAGNLRQIAGDVRTAAQSGADAYGQGAEDVKGVQQQFSKEGFQREAGALQDKVGGYESKIAGMADRAMSGEVGQSQAAMLKGQMEEGRMASQKGSEEKLRREMAQSGASPAEIAAKVAQFQKSSAADQAQAGRSESLSSQLQGQQMGQAQLGQAAGLTGQAMGAVGQQSGMLGQRAGMAGQQASLGAQQAALRGQGAAMQMQGAGQRAGIQGQAAGMQMQGIQGGAQLHGQGMQAGMAGADQQASMLGRGIGAVQASGAARQQQMGGLDQQGGFVDQQAGFTQAQLNDIMAQETQAYTQQQAEAQRQANAQANSGGGGGGGGFDLFNVGSWSDIRLKDNIELLEEGKDGDPNIYSFNYKWDSDTTWSGVMAQELLGTKHADAVNVNPEGYYMVDYHKLGIPMVQLSVKEQYVI